MAKIKLTKSVIDAAQAVELRDTLAPGFLCKVTPIGRKVFMLQYRTNAGERRKPALGQFGELTVDQAPFACPRVAGTGSPGWRPSR